MYMWIHTHLFIIETVTLLDYVHVKVQINSQVFTLCTCVDRLFVCGYSSYSRPSHLKFSRCLLHNEKFGLGFQAPPSFKIRAFCVGGILLFPMVRQWAWLHLGLTRDKVHTRCSDAFFWGYVNTCGCLSIYIPRLTLENVVSLLDKAWPFNPFCK